MWMYLFFACTGIKSELEVVLSCGEYVVGIEAYGDLIEAICVDQHLHLSTPTGLPDHRVHRFRLVPKQVSRLQLLFKILPLMKRTKEH